MFSNPVNSTSKNKTIKTSKAGKKAANGIQTANASMFVPKGDTSHVFRF
jgi:hypothetical protein